MAKSSLPICTIVITSFGYPDTLEAAIRSALSQSYKEVETIVVDDNGVGTKNQIATKKVVESFKGIDRPRYLAHATNMNGAAARNTGWRHSSGEYLLFLDNDDLLTSSHVERNIGAIQKHSKAGCVLCDVLICKKGLSEDYL